jgi:hypothetical protein
MSKRERGLPRHWIEDRDFLASHTTHPRVQSCRYLKGNISAFTSVRRKRTGRQRIQIRSHCIMYRLNSGLTVHSLNFKAKGGRSTVAGKDKYKMAAPLQCLSTYLNRQQRCGFSKHCWFRLFKISGIRSVSVGKYLQTSRSNVLRRSSGFEAVQTAQTSRKRQQVPPKTKASSNDGLMSCLACWLSLKWKGLKRHIWMGSGINPKNQYIMKTFIFWVITRRNMVPNRRFGTTYRSHGCTLRRVITGKTDVFISTAAETLDHANQHISHTAR